MEVVLAQTPTLLPTPLALTVPLIQLVLTEPLVLTEIPPTQQALMAQLEVKASPEQELTTRSLA